ncbi:hypothetical protein AMQ84_22360 [Paenibacillus riograndensis]|uniref:Flagellar protein FliT n=1 Tax=Paenibacillus riograndensis TaxID=483937 RepID=A0A132TRV5_9BACL|nr:flagellar protein FliT [Paenibacillus riograndensis]KWX73796.1 hypothetical protein AMQ84_22360 [Paenibacillus riograndensis]
MAPNNFDILFAELQVISAQAIKDIAIMDEDDLTAFVDRREKIVDAMKPFLPMISAETKQLIEQMLQDEKVIVNRMHELKNEAGEWLQNLGTVRIQQNAYHQSFSIDSLFIDHRK